MRPAGLASPPGHRGEPAWPLRRGPDAPWRRARAPPPRPLPPRPRRRRAAILRARLAAEEPRTSVGWSKCSGCGYFDRCWPAAVERHSVGLLPWVDRGLVSELEARGVETYDQLLERFDADSLAELERPRGRK